MNWGNKIAISFIIFIGIIVTMVVISMKQDISLVSTDYYEQEIAYQDQIDRMERTRGLEKQPEILLDRNTGKMNISVNDWEQGLWKVKLSWSAGGADYYLEEIVNL